MTDAEWVWVNPHLIYPVALVAVLFLVTTVWLLRRKQKTGRQAGLICLVLSIILHAALLLLIPRLPLDFGGSARVDPDSSPGVAEVPVSVFQQAAPIDFLAGQAHQSTLTPLPVADLTDLSAEPAAEAPAETPEQHSSAEKTATRKQAAENSIAVVDDAGGQPVTPTALADVAPLPDPAQRLATDNLATEMDQLLGNWLTDSLAKTQSPQPDQPTDSAATSAPKSVTHSAPQQPIQTQRPTSPRPVVPVDQVTASADASTPAAATQIASPASTPGLVDGDFANRTGAAKQLAIAQTGGDANTEAAVAAALRYLTRYQRDDGGWDSRAAGGGVERRPLGESRSDAYGSNAGSRSDAASTGLALLAMLGAGNTHQTGAYSDNVYRGLVYLIRNQQPSGSLAGNATLYAANYCHGMAGLALSESAVMTRDASAIEATRRALRYSLSMQHPVTGGFRYTAGDPGDTSQLGWQAMVIDSSRRAGVPVPPETIGRLQTFLRSVRAGRTGGLASYRPGERPTRTMTAEALATRLLIGEAVPASEIYEIEQFLLEQPPGVGVDNYYYWYYGTIALHQLQDAAWQRWNAALKERLLATQNPDGSWPTTSLWGGYGGSVYTTAMATLCLESYYRHTPGDDTPRVADGR